MEQLPISNKPLPCAGSHHLLLLHLPTGSMAFNSITVYSSKVLVVTHFHLDGCNYEQLHHGTNLSWAHLLDVNLPINFFAVNVRTCACSSQNCLPYPLQGLPEIIIVLSACLEGNLELESLKDSHLLVSLGEMPASVNQSETGFSLASLDRKSTRPVRWSFFRSDGMVNVFFQGTIGIDGFSMVLPALNHHH